MLLLALLAVPAVSAGTLYRCSGAQGEIVYSSSRSGYSDCRAVTSYRPEADKPSAPRAASAPKPDPESAPEPTASESAEPVVAEAVTARSQRRAADPVVQFRSAPGGQSPREPEALAGLGKPKVTRGAIYRYEHDGVLHYTNVRPTARDATVLFTYIQSCYDCEALPGVDWNAVRLNLDAYSAEIAGAALAHGVDPALVRAIMHAESAFRPDVVSHKGAQGLMQLIPATAERFGVQDAFDPAQNIDGGVRYLAWLLDRFDGDVRLAAAGYNAGEGAVSRYGGVPPYAETERYVERVGLLHQRYREAAP